MKSRGVYETPGGTVLLAAHRAIESITLDRGAAHLKDELMPRYAELIYNGFWFAPEREMLQALIDKSQENVTGTVRLKLFKGAVQVVGRQSPRTLYSQAFATFEKDTVYNQRDAEGFIRLNALRLRDRRAGAGAGRGALAPSARPATSAGSAAVLLAFRTPSGTCECARPSRGFGLFRATACLMTRRQYAERRVTGRADIVAGAEGAGSRRRRQGHEPGRRAAIARCLLGAGRAGSPPAHRRHRGAAGRHRPGQRAGAAAVRPRHRRPGPARRAAGGTACDPGAGLCGGAWLSKVLNELRWSLYGPIEQRTRRRLARQALEHLHALSLSFHLARRTGQISRMLDKGLNGARELLFDGVFLILPLAAEIAVRAP